MGKIKLGIKKEWTDKDKKDWYDFLVTKRHMNTTLDRVGVQINGNEYSYNGRKLRLCYTNQDLTDAERGKIKRSMNGEYYTTFNGKDSKNEYFIKNTLKKGLKIK